MLSIPILVVYSCLLWLSCTVNMPTWDDILFVILAILTYSASYYIYIWKEVGGGSLENNFLQQWSEKKKTIGIKENM